MANLGNGLYYESEEIRNAVLSRNIGKYKGYMPSMYMTGGRAIGDPYAVIDEVTPKTLDDRMKSGQSKGLLLHEGGLFGYTHESLKVNDEWMNRGVNTAADTMTYFDYDSTAEMLFNLSLEPKVGTWWDVGNNHFVDYRGYISGVFAGEGLSFFQTTDVLTPKKNYINDIINDYIPDGVGYFIDSFAGTLADDDSDKIFDTRLGKIGMAAKHTYKQRQINLSNKGRGKTITQDPKKFMGLGSGNEYRYGRGISYDFVEDKDIFIRDVSDIIQDLDRQRANVQEEFLRRDIKENTYKSVLGDVYVSYFNDESGRFSIDGKFRGAGTYDDTIAKNEHYDERDEINQKDNRNILSKKMSYGSVAEISDINAYDVENIGIITNNGFSSRNVSLLEKTKELFKEHKIKTLIGRFHTSNDDIDAKSVNLIQSATNSEYGISHGRNLLKKNPSVENEYDNPYCRVWTYHHQYSKLTDLIRPFTENGNFMELDDFQKDYPGRPILHNQRQNSWGTKSVLNKNGFVNIAPMTDKSGTKKIETKQCMFSIENLAWKSVLKNNGELDEYEIGPHGGRIMWFPPYNLTFNESVSANYGSNDFIGRGERIYSYMNTERTGTLTFTILADHPSILDYWRRKKPSENDEKDEFTDEKVLRFFAGCDTLGAPGTVGEQESGIKNNVNSINVPVADRLQATENGQGENEAPNSTNDATSQNKENEDGSPKPYMPNEFTKDNSIGFYMYFPNNLSGIDFISDPATCLDYLMNGKNGFEYKSKSEIIPELGGKGYEIQGGTGLTDTEKQTEVREHNTIPKNDKNRDYYWGYGVDYDKLTERLTGGTTTVYWQNYCDTANFNLNSTPNSADDSCGYAFTDVVKALYPSINVSAADGKNVDKIKEILQIGSAIVENKVRKFYFCVAGYASVQGVEDRNVGLSNRRAAFLRRVIESSFQGMNKSITFVDSALPVKTGIEGGENNNNVSSKSAKMGRYAKAVIYWKDEEVSDAADSSETNAGLAANDNYSQMMYTDREPYITLPDGFAKPDGVIDPTWLASANESGWQVTNMSGTTYYAKIEQKNGEWGEWAYVKMPDMRTVKENAIPKKKDEETREEGEAASYGVEMQTSNYSSTRYGDEEAFFTLLDENDPVLYKQIVDKVKYFDPAYHSITPEGFNARLSFLHQCTRQGPTVSSSDLSNNATINKAGYAGNLSFGRPPICILRLGDFYNTRIVIQSLSIQYDSAQWDLNPEGIGVQPMLANVTIGFTFQGGSSLGGPIQRLQNAVSFNYYANQEVYDDRADSITYKESGNGRRTSEVDEETSYLWMPGLGTTGFGEIKRVNEKMSEIFQSINNTAHNDAKEDKKETDVDAARTGQEIARSDAETALSTSQTTGVLNPETISVESNYGGLKGGIETKNVDTVKAALNNVKQMGKDEFKKLEQMYEKNNPNKYFYNDIYEVIGTGLSEYEALVSNESVYRAILGPNGEDVVTALGANIWPRKGAINGLMETEAPKYSPQTTGTEAYEKWENYYKTRP